MDESTRALSSDETLSLQNQNPPRLNVRDELELERKGVKANNGRAWAFLNSSFGVFFCSAILVPLVVAAYTWYDSRLKVERSTLEAAAKMDRETADLIERLDLEISYRLSTSMSRLQAAHRKFGDGSAMASVPPIKVALHPLMVPANANTPPLFPEFSSFSGLALMAELRRHLPEGKSRGKPVLGSVGYAVTKLNGLDESLELTPQTPKQMASELIGVMSDTKDSGGSPRWDKGFYYTDCSKAEPFC